MLGWLHATLVAVAAAILALSLLLILRRCFFPKTPPNLEVSDGNSLHNAAARLHQVSPHHHLPNRIASKKANSYHLFQRDFSNSTKPPAFSWSDHPSLVTDAVENGWPHFAFTTFVSSSASVKSARSLLGACAADQVNEPNVEIGWEVCEGSSDFVQKISFNPNSQESAASVVRAALPLPGPNLGNSSFPQEAYFEITIVACNRNWYDHSYKKEKFEGDRIKLIREDFNAKNSPDSVRRAVSIHSQSQKPEELKIGKKERDNDVVSVCIGLTVGGPLLVKVPGRYPGSIGFSSTGSVHLHGTKLVFESEKGEWGRSDKVIGCGYNPSQKKVFFTVDSQLVHEIHCKTEEFGSPLYPTLASDADVEVLVNLGQSPFKFTPANLQRTPNPCFIGPPAASSGLEYDDSKELFSMGRIDSQWLQRSATRSNNNTVNSIRALEEYDQESEGDLFEIVLESTGRSPYSTMHH